MKVLFVMRHSGYVRNFESTLRMLCDRGHTVHLAFQIGDTHWLLDASDVPGQLAEQYPRFSRGAAPVRDDEWGFLARELRGKLDYLRYLEPVYRDAPTLRARATRDVPKEFLRRTEQGLFATPAGRAAVAGWLRAIDRAIPTDPRIDAFLQAWQPDILVLTPLVEPEAPQAEYVRSARALGMRTALCVASWDNLTNKGLVHGHVDMVAVWNEMMRQEAVTLHRIPPERVVVTGAQPFDHWFDWRPGTTRDEFARDVALPTDRPYILYLCSSKFIAPDEVSFVRTWLQQLRNSAVPALREVGVLVRPHPQHTDQWRGVNLGEGGSVVVWPPVATAPADHQSRSDYFDSIFHSAAVVGVNTTALIESAIVGRPVHTLLAPEFQHAQEGTLHFHHLCRVNGGLLRVARDFPEHLAQLDAAVREPHADEARCRRFVESFVRPYGLDVSATPKLVAALEALAKRPAPRPAAAPGWAPLMRLATVRRARRRQRLRLFVLESKAVRRVAKIKQEELSRPRLPKTVRTWKELVPLYFALHDGDRRRFVRATIDSMPGDVLAEGTKPERLDYPDAELYLRVTSKDERNRLKACTKEPFTIDWIHQWVRPGDVFYDIGANVGAYSLVAARKPGGGARVFAFEPSYPTVAALCANIALNNAAADITPIPVALSDTNGLSVFALRALEPGSARHSLGGEPPTDGPSVYDQPVFTFRLDDLIERFGLPWPNHIKLDVDGGELAVLAGAAQVLASPSLRSLLVEVDTSLSDEVAAVLAGRGLRLEAKVNVMNTAGEYRVWYGLFVKQPQGSGQEAREVQVQYVSR